MSEEMTRKEVIWQLKGLLLGELRTTAKERKALEYAIASLETDEAYQLEYERTTKNDLPHCQHTDEEIAKSFIEDVEAVKDLLPTTKNDLGVSSGLENVSSIIDWNNCHTSEQLDSISTTKNDLGVDCISRAQTRTEIEMNASRYTIARERGGMGQVEWSDQLIKVSDAVDIIRNLPSVIPQEPRWIPVSERVPEDSGEYLVSVVDEENKNSWYKQVGVAWFAHKKDYDIKESEWRELGIDETVIAWMPLPKAYREEEE